MMQCNAIARCLVFPKKTIALIVALLTCLLQDLFFAFPENNILHTIVYCILQEGILWNERPFTIHVSMERTLYSEIIKNIGLNIPSLAFAEWQFDGSDIAGLGGKRSSHVSCIEHVI